MKALIFITLFGAGILSTLEAAVDPKLALSTYLGGDGRESAVAVAVGPQGHVYVLGNTAFGTLATGNAAVIRHVTPTPPGFPPGFVLPTEPDVMLVKYAPDLKTIEFFALIGGTESEEALALRVDSQGNAVVLLRTDSADFPTKNAIRGSLQGDSDFAVMKLNSNGQVVAFSTYLGAGGGFSGFGVLAKANLALDNSGSVFICGTTFSSGLPVTAGAFQTVPNAGMPNGFVTKLAGDGSGLLYSTYLGASAADECHAIVVDAQGNAFIGGATTSTNFPLVQPLNAARGPKINGRDPEQLFLAKLNASGSALEFSTFLIGEGEVSALALTPQGAAVMAGISTGGLTTTPNGWQRTVAGGFVLELNPSLTALAYATHVGGTPTSLAVDAAGNLAVAGTTSPGSLRTTHAGFVSSNSLNQSAEAFVMKLDASRRVTYAIRLGGLDSDEGHGVGFLPGGDLALVGLTKSFDFPLVDASRQFPVSDEAFVARISEVPAVGNPGGGSVVTYQYRDRDSANLPWRFYRVRELQP